MCEIEFDDVFRIDDLSKYEEVGWYALGLGFLCSYDEKSGYACQGGIKIK